MARDYRAEKERRRDLARERFPGAPESEIRRIAEGHRSLADLRTTIASGRAVVVDPTPGPRGPDGRYAWLDVNVTMADGRRRTFTLRGQKATTKELRKLSKDLERKGIHVNAIHYLIGQMAKEAA